MTTTAKQEQLLTSTTRMIVTTATTTPRVLQVLLHNLKSILETNKTSFASYSLIQ
jgi:hypothetical protein